MTLALNSFSADTFKLAKNKRSPDRPRQLFYSVAKNSKKDMEKLISSFVKETRPNRYVGSNGNKKAQEFIYNYIKKNVRSKNAKVENVKFVPDFKYAQDMYQSDFDNSKGELSAAELAKWRRFTAERIAHIDTLKNITGHNIVWEKKGSVKPNEVMVVGAHYDTAAFDKKSLKLILGGNQPGADNNASGVSAALSLINILAELDLEKTVRVVFFDFGEIGFLGSHDYAKNLKAQRDIKVASYVELLMLGYDTQSLDKDQQLGNMKMYYSAAGSNIATYFNQMSAKGTFRVKFTPQKKNFLNGDNVSFEAIGVPSVIFTQNWESDFNANRIHSPSDYVATLNIDTLHHATNSIAMAIASWALDL